MGTDLVGVDAADGKVLWSHQWRAAQCTATPIVIGEDGVFITSWYDKKAGALLKVREKGVEVVWENQNLMAKINTPVLFEGHLYGGNSGTESLVCVDAKTGELKWTQKGFEHGGHVAVDGVLLTLSGKTGELVMVQMTPEKYVELGRINPFEKKVGGRLRGNVWAPPIVADGKVIVRDRNTVVCLELR
jgi:outer membrane protein assembly factor BamB